MTFGVGVRGQKEPRGLAVLPSCRGQPQVLPEVRGPSVQLCNGPPSQGTMDKLSHSSQGQDVQGEAPAALSPREALSPGAQ